MILHRVPNGTVYPGPGWTPRLLPKIFDRQCTPEVSQDLQQDPRPVASVAEFAQVTQWLLWGAYSTLKLGELITWQ